jgi:hypothetical protein
MFGMKKLRPFLCNLDFKRKEKIMLLDKIIKKKIAKAIKELAKENKEKAMDYIKNHKDETIALVRKTIMDYIEEHKEEIIKYAIDALIKVVTNK